MLIPPTYLGASVRVTAGAVVAGVLLVRILFPRAFRLRAVRVAALLVLGALGTTHAAWLCERIDLDGLASFGRASSRVAVGLLLAFVGSLPVAAAVHAWAARALLRVSAKPKRRARSTVPTPRAVAPSPPLRAAAAPAAPGASVGRRLVVQSIAASIPVASVVLTARGYVEGSRATALRTIPMAMPDLPAAHEGLSILQLSDLHLGCSKHVGELEAFLPTPLARSLAARGQRRPDLVVLTGDVIDDTDELTPALRRVASLAPRYGAFAILGNHEKMNDLPEIRRIYAKSDVALLVDEGVTLDAGGAKLHVAGIDDPFDTRGEIRPWLRERVARALAKAPAEASRILLSHRPEAFDAASDFGADLVLSGHTRRADRLQRQERLRAALPRRLPLGRVRPRTLAHVHDERLRRLVPVPLRLRRRSAADRPRARGGVTRPTHAGGGRGRDSPRRPRTASVRVTKASNTGIIRATAPSPSSTASACAIASYVESAPSRGRRRRP